MNQQDRSQVENDRSRVESGADRNTRARGAADCRNAADRSLARELLAAAQRAAANPTLKTYADRSCYIVGAIQALAHLTSIEERELDALLCGTPLDGHAISNGVNLREACALNDNQADD